MSPIRAVIFDLGNVLVFHENERVYERFAARTGIPVSEVRRLLTGWQLFEGTNRGQLNGDGIRREVCRLLGVEIPRQEFEQIWSCHFTVNTSMIPAIESLLGQVALVLLSNTNALHTAYLRPLLPVLELFDALLFSNEVHLVKPEPAFFELALTRARVRPSEAVFFDDLERYVQAARDIGIHAFVFTDTTSCVADLRRLGVTVAG